MSKRFHSLVTTPHAWRVAFSRFFPGQDAIDDGHIPGNSPRDSDREGRVSLRSELRLFTRLTALATWRSEYIMRTRLLRSVARGKPQQIPRGHGASFRSNSAANNANSTVTYNSQLFAPVNHIHAVFDNGRKSPRFIHGADETGVACTSDPNIGKVDIWGLSDPQRFRQFADDFREMPRYGLGNGLCLLVPNVMDVSQPFGMVYGTGGVTGQVYFRSSDEMHGRKLSISYDYPIHPTQTHHIADRMESTTAVWIAKSSAIPSMTDGLVGIMYGCSNGTISAYSLGANNLDGYRLSKGELTARWAPCPGIPIISISMDDSYNAKRKGSGRIWAMILNALGEVFYLTETIQRGPLERNVKLDEESLNKIAWGTGRSVEWKLVEPTRRVAREDPYQEADFDGNYSPRSSPYSSGLSEEQLMAENREIETFLSFRPVNIKKVCEGWDMRRRLEVDFAGDDGHGVGESAVVIKCGTPESGPAHVRRFTRTRTEQASFDHYPTPWTPPTVLKPTAAASLFGSGTSTKSSKTNGSTEPAISMSPVQPHNVLSLEEWKVTNFAWEGSQNIELTTSAVDMSYTALLGVFEDPSITKDGGSSASSASATPEQNGGGSVLDIPGYRARFIAVGTSTGTVHVWDMRGSQSSNPSITNTLQPVRTIHTDSPQISCLAVSALYLVHGGNDGLVQAWDPLASTIQPIRTLNSRFSSRARRRLVQAEASIQGVGINLFAAGAVILDPDPTSLRGMVTLGTHLRYWAYSSNASDETSSKKRRLRRSSERGINSATDKYTHTGRGILMDYIANEQQELKQDKQRRDKEKEHLEGRFGVGLAGLSEEEALRYAELISEEAFQKEEERRFTEATSSPVRDGPASVRHDLSSEAASAEPSVSGRGPSPKLKTEDELENEIEEAIRLSMLDGVEESYTSPPSGRDRDYDVPFVVKQKKSRRSASTSPSTSQASKDRRSAKGKAREGMEMDDLDYALQLSLAEEQSRVEIGAAVATDFPALDDAGNGKGKGKGRAI